MDQSDCRILGKCIIIPCIVRPKRNAIIDLLYDSNLVGKNGRGGEKEKERRKREKK